MKSTITAVHVNGMRLMRSVRIRMHIAGMRRGVGSMHERAGCMHLRAGMLFLLCLLAPAVSAQTLLVDFGADAGGNSFGMAGWETLIKSPGVSYTDDGPGGLTADASADEFSDYQGVRGSSRMFSTADRIVVTWHNRSQETVRFTARVSFTDADQPDGGSSTGRWFTMRSHADYRETWSEAGPGETVRTVFAIAGHGVHRTDSAYALVNVNLAIEWGSSDMKQHLVCDRIELDAADNTPPDAPTGLRAVLMDSRIDIAWTEPDDDVGVADYLVFMDGRVEGYSRDPAYTACYLEPAQEYRFTVVARDVMGNESPHSAPVTVRTAAFYTDGTLIDPREFTYVGAFRVPEDFNWGGEALAYRADGDPGGGFDGCPGSLFVTNVNQPENGLVGEVSIPAPDPAAGSVEALPEASILQSPVNIRPAGINAWEYVDIWRTGLAYLQDEQRLYSSWSIHYTVSGEKHATLSACDAGDLTAGPYLGPWYLGAPGAPPIEAQFGSWLCALPADWAAQHVDDRRLAVGRFRDGGLSGLGPTMYAWEPVGTSPPAANAQRDFTTLLEYGPVEGSDNYHFPDAVRDYNHSDDWRGMHWISAGEQRAVAVVGLKAKGHNWYGYHGEHMPLDWVIADVPMPTFDQTDPDGKGWRAHGLCPTVMLYDVDDLAAVASGLMESHQPQAYGAVRLDTAIFFSSAREIFSTAWGEASRLLYVTEFVREAEGALVTHVFRVDAAPVGMHDAAAHPRRIELTHAPTPLRSAGVMTYTIPRAAAVSLRVYDMLGREVSVLLEGRRNAGTHRVRFDARGLRPGMYLAVLRAGDSAAMDRLVVVR